jgi:hypothetical protein
MLRDTRMRLLFAISTASFCALFGVVLAAARHIRASRAKGKTPLAQGPLREVFEAGEFRTPRSLHLVQNVAQNVTRNVDQNPAQPTTPQQRPQLGYIPSDPHDEGRKRLAQAVLVNRRKAPQSVRPALGRSADWALYNRNLGERTDPSTQPLRSATTARGSSLNRA